jgi:hypothetical protein
MYDVGLVKFVLLIFLRSIIFMEGSSPFGGKIVWKVFMECQR